MLVTLLVVLFEMNGRPDAPLRGASELARQAEALAYDLRLRTFADRRELGGQPVVIVDVDEASLAAVGQWPWPRTRIATLVERLAAREVAVVGFDIVFSEPEINPVDRILEEAGPALPPEMIEVLRTRAPALDGDRVLARTVDALADTEVATGVFLGQGTRSVGARPSAIEFLAPEIRTSLLRFSSWTGPPETLARHTLGGHVITVPDDLDGVIRRAPLVVRLGDAIVPALALEMVRAYMLLDDIGIDLAPQGASLIPTSVRLGSSVRIPLDARGRVLVPYRGGAFTFPYLSAVDVLRDDLDDGEAAMLKDAIVLVGTSAIGLADLRSTPTDQIFPGVEIHATLVDALLHAAARAGDANAAPAFPRAPDLVDELTIVGLVLAGLFLSLLMPVLGALATVLLFATATGTWLTIVATAWNSSGLALPMVSPLLLLLTLTFVYLLRGFVRETTTRRGLREMFDQYVPPQHIERMVNDGHVTRLDGDSRVMTVLFADIQGFTRMSEGLSAPEVKRVLNEFFTPITAKILEHQGTIDKYVGDMIMAFWNAPLVDAHHRENAIEAAVAMVEVMERLKLDFAARGLPTVEVGIGLNTGMMNVGDMGSEFRRAYTVLGDAVNTGSRIESLTRRYGVHVLVGEQTRDESEGWVFRFIDRVQVKGKTRSMRIYEPVCREADLDPETDEMLLRWHGAYWKYCDRDWDGAARDLDALIEAAPEQRLYHVYRARVDALRTQDLPRDWDATVVMDEK